MDKVQIVNALASRGFRSGDLVKDAKAFQLSVGLQADGVIGPMTLAELFPRKIEREAPGHNWPLQKDCIAFYGPPGNPRCTAGVVKPKAHLFYDKKIVKAFRCHELVAESMQDIFDKTIDHYGEKEWRRLGLDRFGGCYNLRKMRGGTAWSMHSWGIAVDLDPSRNTLHQGPDTAQFAKPEYNAFWAIVEDEGGYSLGRKHFYDYMHFQFARVK